MEELYDNIVSLGFNCEVSFRIKDYYKKNDIDSYIYTWAYVCDDNLFLDSLNNIDDILSGKITLLPWGMFKCEKYQLSFHSISGVSKLFDKDNNPIQENVDKAIKELIDRTNHLKDKFNKLLKSDEKTLFVMKVRKQNDAIDFIKKVYNILKDKYVLDNFTLLVVIEENQYNEQWENLNSKDLKIRTIKNFAPDNNTENGGDLDGWKKVFNEFNKKKNLLLKWKN